MWLILRIWEVGERVVEYGVKVRCEETADSFYRRSSSFWPFWRCFARNVEFANQLLSMNKWHSSELLGAWRHMRRRTTSHTTSMVRLRTLLYALLLILWTLMDCTPIAHCATLHTSYIADVMYLLILNIYLHALGDVSHNDWVHESKMKGLCFAIFYIVIFKLRDNKIWLNFKL